MSMILGMASSASSSATSAPTAISVGLNHFEERNDFIEMLIGITLLHHLALSRSRISASNASVGVGGGAGASFLNRLYALTRRKITRATIRKLITLWTRLPYLTPTPPSNNSFLLR